MSPGSPVAAAFLVCFGSPNNNNNNDSQFYNYAAVYLMMATMGIIQCILTNGRMSR